MRLPTFIIDNIDQIIVRWKDAAHPSISSLESQAKQILIAVAADIESSVALPSSSAAITVRTVLRTAPDFNLQHMSEALRLARMAVSTAWKAEGDHAYEDLLRFHEAIDLAVAEAISQHALQVERTRSLFLGMLGHDLRTPLSAIHMGCEYLVRNDVAPERKLEAVARVNRCARAMEGMIRDVLDFARSRLGKSMPLVAREADIGALCRAALEDARVEHPRCEFDVDVCTETFAIVDAARLRRALHNLLDSAARNGARGMPVRFAAKDDGGALVFRVQSAGPALSADVLRTMFDPIAQLAVAGASIEGAPPADLGLELFIAREIARAHGGDIAVSSSEEDGTVFEARLPRR